MAVSLDGGLTFTRVHEGPVVDRNRLEPYFVTTPFVCREGGMWKMWYASATGWVGEPPSPAYMIKYAESRDGLDWTRDNVTCIEPKSSNEANGRPWVERDEGTYRMWYCSTGASIASERSERSYRLGYAEIRRRRELGAAGRASRGRGARPRVGTARWSPIQACTVERGRRASPLQRDGFGRSGIGHAVADEPT